MATPPGHEFEDVLEVTHKLTLQLPVVFLRAFSVDQSDRSGHTCLIQEIVVTKLRKFGSRNTSDSEGTADTCLIVLADLAVMSCWSQASCYNCCQLEGYLTLWWCLHLAQVATPFDNPAPE